MTPTCPARARPPPRSPSPRTPPPSASTTRRRPARPTATSSGTLFTATVDTGNGESRPRPGDGDHRCGTTSCPATLTPDATGGQGGCRIGATALGVGGTTASASYGGDSDLSGSGPATTPFTVITPSKHRGDRVGLPDLRGRSQLHQYRESSSGGDRQRDPGVCDRRRRGVDCRRHPGRGRTRWTDRAAGDSPRPTPTTPLPMWDRTTVSSSPVTHLHHPVQEHPVPGLRRRGFHDLHGHRRPATARACRRRRA